MSAAQGHWPVPSDGPSVATVVPVAVGVARRRPVLLASVFAGIALLAILLGLVVPKKYSASTSILVENGNIIEPLMEGRAVSTSVANRAMMARDVAFSRRVMNDILKTGGWMAENPSALEQDRLIEQIKSRTSISTPMPAANAKTPVMGNLIQVSYYDSDPKRAYLVTKRFGELIIQESLANKERESRAAFEFIDGQVEQYHAKLAQAEAKLEDYRIANPDAREGVTGDVTSRIAELRRLVDTARMDMIDSGSEVAALQAQLSGESEISAVTSRSSQIRARLAELNAQREQLLLTYTDQYPDVVRINHQISDLEQELKGARTSASSRMAGSPIAIEASATMNPLYTELRSRLSAARQRQAAASSRVATGQSLLGEEMARSTRIAGSERSLAELTRDYEVNRDLYQDLLKRRENARVSMNLDAKREGLSFRVQEPAQMPLRPSGLRLMHFAVAGLALALLAPLLLVAGYVKMDPRVRTPLQIERVAGLPVIGAIPHYSTRSQRVRGARKMALASLMVLSVPLVFGLILAIKLANPS